MTLIKLLLQLILLDSASIGSHDTLGLVSGFCSDARQAQEQMARFEPLLARIVAMCSLFVGKTLNFSILQVKMVVNEW